MKHLKKFNELQTIVSNTSGSGKTKERDLIYNEPSNSKSPSSKILLKDKLKKAELKSLTDLTDLKSVTNYADVKILVRLNNLRFLGSKLEKHGKLSCEYCGKEPLFIYDFLNELDIDSRFIKKRGFINRNGATCDHKVPQSKGGDKFDHDNLAVSCYRCNQKKGEMDYDRWKNRKSIKSFENFQY